MITPLKKYLFFKEKTISKFANELNMNRGYINKIVLGLTKPSRLLAEEIERRTAGEVKAIDMLGEE